MTRGDSPAAGRRGVVLSRRPAAQFLVRPMGGYERFLVKRIAVAESTEVRENEIFVARAHGLDLLLTRVGPRVYAVQNKCSHLGWSMARGSISGSALQCPWHGSRFDVCSGKNLDWVNSFAGVPMPPWTHRLIALGKEPAALRTVETFEESGRVFIEVAD